MTETAPIEPARSTRLASLDALRGFDMFCIVGLEGLVEGLRRAGVESPVFQKVVHQLEHVEWAGFHFEDLIFPMFLYIVGVSLVFSTSKAVERDGRGAATAKILRRGLLLYALGIFYYGGFATPFAQIRLLGVLQRIAICYACSALIFVYFRPRGVLAWCVGLLVGYWLLLAFVPVPGGTAGDFAEGHNLANWVDKTFLPLKKWDGDHDPEGLLSTLPAIANCLIGVFAGLLLRDTTRREWQKALILAGAGLAMVALGWAWAIPFPVIKKLWTSSFVLVACGYASLLLALFHLVIEVGGWRGWALPFLWIGANPIAIYLLGNLVEIEPIARRFVGGDVNRIFGAYGTLAVAVVGVAILLAFARFLYVRKIFLRV
jgi:predicted acyltransferase